MSRVILVVGAAALLPACGPNRAEWMAKAAKYQAAQATQSIGSPPEVRKEAAVASTLLGRMAGEIEADPPIKNKQAALGFAQDASDISSGLLAIAQSRTDSDFANAVLAMCNPDRLAAAPRVGRVMLGIAGAAEDRPPANLTPEQQQQEVAYFQTFGERLIDIPARCEQARNALAEASTQEQQAEAQHEANVSRALTAAAIVFAGTAAVAGEVGAAAATRPPVANNYVYVNQANGY